MIERTYKIFPKIWKCFFFKVTNTIGFWVKIWISWVVGSTSSPKIIPIALLEPELWTRGSRKMTIFVFWGEAGVRPFQKSEKIKCFFWKIDKNRPVLIVSTPTNVVLAVPLDQKSSRLLFWSPSYDLGGPEKIQIGQILGGMGVPY